MNLSVTAQLVPKMAPKVVVGLRHLICYKSQTVIQLFGHDELIVMSGVSLLGKKHRSLREIKLFKRYAKLCVEERFKPNTPYFLQLNLV